jgi:hypothetical protein
MPAPLRGRDHAVQSQGIGLEDVAAAALVYERATERGIGIHCRSETRLAQQARFAGRIYARRDRAITLSRPRELRLETNRDDRRIA